MIYNVENDTVNNHVWGYEFVVNEDSGYSMVWVQCPYCHGGFALDWTYLDKTTSDVHCPMCCMEVIFDGWDEDA